MLSYLKNYKVIARVEFFYVYLAFAIIEFRVYQLYIALIIDKGNYYDNEFFLRVIGILWWNCDGFVIAIIGLIKSDRLSLYRKVLK